jgi:hypothetical protein
LTNVLPIVFAIALEITISLAFGYMIARKSRLVGVSFAMSGFFLGLVLVVNYYLEVTWPVFVIVLTAMIACGALGAFQIARQSAISSSG